MKNQQICRHPDNVCEVLFDSTISSGGVFVTKSSTGVPFVIVARVAIPKGSYLNLDPFSCSIVLDR